MKRIKYNLIFNRQKRLNKYGEALVQIRAYQNKRNRYFSTQVYIAPGQWDSRRNEVKSHPNQDILNRNIRDQLEQLRQYEIDAINQQGSCSLDELNTFVISCGMPSFYEFVETELTNSRLAPSSRQSQTNTINKLKEYRENLFFRHITFKLIDGFDQYLRKCNLSDTTIAKHHKDLKKFINLAIKKDYIEVNKNPYKKFQVKRGQVRPRTFLTTSEIRRLESLEFDWTEKHLELIRDAFLFACFTGLRFGDLVRVAPCNIIDGERGLTLEMQAEKTKKHNSLPLYNLFKDDCKGGSRPERIIKKYLNIQKQKKYTYSDYQSKPFFKELTNQYFNRELKILASKARIVKEVTAHVARHTFGTHLATKVKPAILQELMQHSKINTTMVYVHLSKKLIDMELDNVNW